MFNSVKHTRAADTSSTICHKQECETPLFLYIAMKVHAITCKRSLIDTLFSLGICVSYDCLLKLISDKSNGVCQKFTIDEVRSGLFTVAAVDNIDYNPSSATAKDSFHGTGISLLQHPSHESEGCDRGALVIDQTSSHSKSVIPLPSQYTSVPPASITSKEFTAPIVGGSVRPTTFQTITEAKVGELEWLKTVMAALTKEKLDRMDWISWSAYHASIQEIIIPPAAINALLPFFLDSAHSVAMIKHSMTIVQVAVQRLNPGQVPVIAADQPLFALAKQIQWTWPNTLGENHFVIMFGGLHIEMAVLKVQYTCIQYYIMLTMHMHRFIHKLNRGGIACTKIFTL